MMRQFFAFALALALCGFATPAAAEPAASGWWNMSDEQIRTTLKRVRGGEDLMRAFALCSAKRNPKAVATLLATADGSGDEKGASSRLTTVNANCLPDGEFSLAGLSVRGALAEAMFWTYHAEADGNALAFPVDASGDRSRFGNCAVKGNVNAAMQVIAAAPKSQAESDAFAEMLPSLKACIESTQFSSMDTPSARTLIAEALYRAAANAAAGK